MSETEWLAVAFGSRGGESIFDPSRGWVGTHYKVGNTRPLKILRIITRLNIGGPAQHVVFLTRGLNSDGFQSRLAFGAIDESEGDMSYLVREKETAFTEVDFLKNESGFLGNLKALFQLYRLICKEKPDIVHLHLLKARFLGGLAARFARVPFVLETLHGDLFAGYYGYLTTQAILMAERILGHFVVDKVIAISERVKENIARFHVAPAKKIAVVPLGLELNKFMHLGMHVGKLREEIGVRENNLLVGIVGRMVPIKGHRYFLQAAREVLRVRSNVSFIVVGDGVLRKSLESESRQLGISESVFFLGWRRDVVKIYGDLDVVVLSSLNEGTPVSLIEAMAAGRAVVGTAVGGVPDVVEDGVTGLLVPSEDPGALAGAVLKLLADNGLRRLLGGRARAAVYPKYDVSRLVADMRDLYFKLCAATGAPAGVGSSS